jgi:hypothetical protein
MPRKKPGSFLIPVDRIEGAIREVRGHKVMLDSDLAGLYGVETGALVRAVKRNIERFPADFQFRLTKHEFEALRSQSGDSGQWGGRRYPPLAFTEHGAVMAASVLKSKRAAEVSVFVVRAFVRMRTMLADRREVALKLAEIEARISKQDVNVAALFDAIRQLMRVSAPGRGRPIGFPPQKK